MLELRPTCEHCDRALPPASEEAMICSFECTFCRSCVTEILDNVCPNCGGGFCDRPVRPATDHRAGNCLANYPAATRAVRKAVDPDQHRRFAATLRSVDPHHR